MDMPPRGLYGPSFPKAEKAMFKIVWYLYWGTTPPHQPLFDGTLPKLDRNKEIITRYTAGETIPELAEVFGISRARIHQILHSKSS